jgi:hypothetical protein
MYNLQDFIVTTNIIDNYTFDIYFLHKETKKIWHSRDSESHRGEPIFYNFLKIEQLIDDINYNEKDIGHYEIVFRNIDKDPNKLEVTFNTKSLNYSMWLHEYPTIICKNCIEEFTYNDIIIDSKNYTFCKKCYDEKSCYLCNTVKYYSDTILNCDVCNKIVCSECYRKGDNTGYCKDCFSNVSKNIE